MPDRITSLLSGDVAQRRLAANSLATISPAEAQVAAVALARAAGDDDEQVREWAAGALEQLGPPLDAQVADLVMLLSHEQPDVGYWAATLLGRLGDRGATAAPHLVVTLEGSGPLNVRERAAWALGQIGQREPTAIAALQTAAASTETPRLARLAQQALNQIVRAR